MVRNILCQRFSMPSFFQWSAWLLVAAAAAVFIESLVSTSGVLEPLKKNAVPAGVLLALAGHLFTQARNATETAEKRSLFNLESCAKAFEYSISLLADGNNNRTKWIEAGRSLAHAEELASGVSVDAHLRVLELNRLKFRSSFYAVLTSQPATFFYGVPLLHSSLDEAAKASTAPEEKDGRITTSTLHELAEESIHAVWKASRWPANYEDPLGTRFSNEERGKLLLMFPALNAFFEHKSRWRSASGNLHPLDESE